MEESTYKTIYQVLTWIQYTAIIALLLFTGYNAFYKKRLWYIIHNCIAHPLMGLFPAKPIDEFHEYTYERTVLEAQQKEE